MVHYFAVTRGDNRADLIEIHTWRHGEIFCLRGRKPVVQGHLNKVRGTRDRVQLSPGKIDSIRTNKRSARPGKFSYRIDVTRAGPSDPAFAWREIQCTRVELRIEFRHRKGRSPLYKSLYDLTRSSGIAEPF